MNVLVSLILIFILIELFLLAQTLSLRIRFDSEKMVKNVFCNFA